MGIFTRFRDIISANINAMLDRAEDPHKLIRLMIHEMEDTLVELKAACAGVMAEQAKIRREIEVLEDNCRDWEAKAELAVRKQREDLAREALLEKRRYVESCEARKDELAGHQALGRVEGEPDRRYPHGRPVSEAVVGRRVAAGEGQGGHRVGDLGRVLHKFIVVDGYLVLESGRCRLEKGQPFLKERQVTWLICSDPRALQ